MYSVDLGRKLSSVDTMLQVLVHATSASVPYCLNEAFAG